MSPNLKRLLALAGMAAPIVLTFGWIIAGLIQGDAYSVSSQEISDLGALTADHAWFWNAATCISGALVVAFAFGLEAELGKLRSGLFGAVLIGVVGAGSFLDGLVREDCPLSTSDSCQALRDGPGLSWHHQAHDIESLIVGLASLLAPFVLARAFARLPAWSDLRAVSLIVGGTMVAVLLAYIALYGESGGGVMQRLLLSVFLLWMFVIALRLHRNA